MNNINAAVREGNVLATAPLLAVDPDRLRCLVTNVSDATRSIDMQLIHAGSGEVLWSRVDSVPSHTTTGLQSVGNVSPFVFCKIVVIDGRKSDVRGVLAVFASGTSDRDPVVAQ